jgi:DNA-directed RNA polymerase subunit L
MDPTKMAKVQNIKTSNKGFEYYCELQNFPLGFVNALRRILITGIPRVVIGDVQILQNTSQIPHEMLKHRTQRLPVNVKPSDSATIKDAKIELRIVVNKEARKVTTDDFVVEAGREGLMMHDRDFDTPSLFMKLRAGEIVHIVGRLELDSENASHVCTASVKWHVDPDLAKADRKVHVDGGGDPRLFDNFLIQRSFSRDKDGRPNSFELSIESIGVLKSRELLSMAVHILRKRLDNYMNEALKNISHEQYDKDIPNAVPPYSVSIEQGGHTLGALIQEVLYNDPDVEFASYDILHPLKPMMKLQFTTKKSPESVLTKAKRIIEEYCLLVENNDGEGSGV